MILLAYLCAVLHSITITAVDTDQTHSGLPIVDLGYVLQRATSFDTFLEHINGFFNFSNIRYAQAPIGELRFRAPARPQRDGTIQTGEIGHICYQAVAYWLLQGPVMAPQVDASNGSMSSMPLIYPTTLADAPPANPEELEDCLFLDVYVPRRTFLNRFHGEGSSVMVWIHGGGFTFGSKVADASPAGIMAQSARQTGKEIIFVAINYRLGAFGFSGGPMFQSSGTLNAGLLDQRLALDWVQENIKSFGGNPNKVTVIGESSGGTSILQHITSYGGENGPDGAVPFQQAILQSSSSGTSTPNDGDAIFQDFLRLANVTSIQAARQLPSEQLRRANYVQIARSQNPTSTYLVAIDNIYVQDSPIKLLREGRFHKDVRVMTGHNTDEGLLFVVPYAQVAAGYHEYVSTFLNATNATEVTEVLYPPIFDGTYGYTTDLERAALTAGDALFVCTVTAITAAFNNLTYNYVFAVPPAIHASDLDFSFYTGPTEAQAPNDVAAITLQRWLSSFVVNGQPAATGTIDFGLYGRGEMVQVLNNTGVNRVVDGTSKGRCDFWNGEGR